MNQPTPPLLPDQILELALKQERSAHEFYSKMAAECTVAFMKDLLVGLRDEEAKHVKTIQTMLTQLKSGGTPKFKH